MPLICGTVNAISSPIISIFFPLEIKNIISLPQYSLGEICNDIAAVANFALVNALILLRDLNMYLGT